MVSRFRRGAPVEEGRAVEVAVDVRALYFFDEDASQTIYGGDTSEKGASA
jgi:hypothetical protein